MVHISLYNCRYFCMHDYTIHHLYQLRYYNRGRNELYHSMHKRYNTDEGDVNTMREIKFRVYDKEKKLMLHTGDEVDLYDEHDELHSEDEWYPCKDIQIPLSMFSGFQKNFKDRIILMQFINNTDKNGKEIYEKDICHVNENDTDDGSFDMMGLYGEFGIVQVRKGCVGMMLIHTKRWVSIDEEELEVLGNIYENPELLEA